MEGWVRSRAVAILPMPLSIGPFTVCLPDWKIMEWPYPRQEGR